MIVVDTSAMIAIFLDEPEGSEFVAIIRAAERPVISATGIVESLIVLDNRTGDDNRDLMCDMLNELALMVEPVALADAWLAAEAYRRFGRGRHPAKLNYGDCFAYALARRLDLPLLFKGDDFRHTDIRSAC